jgi:hypothetical protein
MRGKAQGMIKDALIMEKRIYRDRWKEKKLLDLSDSFSIHEWAT